MKREECIWCVHEV